MPAQAESLAEVLALLSSSYTYTTSYALTLLKHCSQNAVNHWTGLYMKFFAQETAVCGSHFACLEEIKGDCCNNCSKHVSSEYHPYLSKNGNLIFAEGTPDHHPAGSNSACICLSCTRKAVCCIACFAALLTSMCASSWHASASVE